MHTERPVVAVACYRIVQEDCGLPFFALQALLLVLLEFQPPVAAARGLEVPLPKGDDRAAAVAGVGSVSA